MTNLCHYDTNYKSPGDWESQLVELPSTDWIECKSVGHLCY